jgi:hypothetical protein
MSQRYDRLLDEWATETPDTYEGMAAYLKLVGAIIDSERADQRGNESCAILSTERDFGHALELLTRVRGWLNKAAIDEAVAAERRAGRVE